jgi:hypothetical protein
MSYPDPALEPPFLGGIVPANDADFPVQITERARKRLFWHIVNSPGYAGPGILCECWPVVADLLTDDLDLLEARKRLIPGELWSRCKEQGSLRLARGDRARDGRPWHSRVAIRDQKKKEWRAPGGYLDSR